MSALHCLATFTTVLATGRRKIQAVNVCRVWLASTAGGQPLLPAGISIPEVWATTHSVCVWHCGSRLDHTRLSDQKLTVAHAWRLQRPQQCPVLPLNGRRPLRPSRRSPPPAYCRSSGRAMPSGGRVAQDGAPRKRPWRLPLPVRLLFPALILVKNMGLRLRQCYICEIVNRLIAFVTSPPAPSILCNADARANGVANAEPAAAAAGTETAGGHGAAAPSTDGWVAVDPAAEAAAASAAIAAAQRYSSPDAQPEHRCTSCWVSHSKALTASTRQKLSVVLLQHPGMHAAHHLS